MDYRQTLIKMIDKFNVTAVEEFKEAGVKHLDRSEGEDSRVGSVKAEEKVLEEDEDSTDDEGEKKSTAEAQ